MDPLPAYYSYSNYTNGRVQTLQANATSLLGWFNTEKLVTAAARTVIVTSVATENQEQKQRRYVLKLRLTQQKQDLTESMQD